MENIFILGFGILASFSFYFLGRMTPEGRFWADVDIIYYPLAVLGAVLFFGANSASRETVAVWQGLYSNQQEHQRIYTANVFNKYFERSELLHRVIDKQKTCLPELENSTLSNICSSDSRMFSFKLYIHNLLPDNNGFKMRFLTPSLAIETCHDEMKLNNDPDRWRKFRSIFSRADDDVRISAGNITDKIVEACQKLLGIPGFISANSQQSLRQSERIPSPGQLVAMQLREWLWPVVVILALGLKIGKAAAARAQQRKRP